MELNANVRMRWLEYVRRALAQGTDHMDLSDWLEGFNAGVFK